MMFNLASKFRIYNHNEVASYIYLNGPKDTIFSGVIKSQKVFGKPTCIRRIF